MSHSYLDPDQFSNLVSRLEYLAQNQGSTTALCFHNHGKNEETLTFLELSQRVRDLASRLQKQCPEESTALILHPSGIDYVISLLACFYAGVIGVPVNLPGPARVKRVLQKLDHITEDCGAVVLLTGQEIIEKSGNDLDAFVNKHRLTIIETSPSSPLQHDDWVAPEIHGETIAFLQYTSGSTGAPKGVINCHDNLLHNIHFQACVNLPSEDAVAVSWLPLYHDMGLIMGILSPLAYGHKAVYLPPTAFAKDPLLWLELTHRHKGTFLPGPNFALQRCFSEAQKNPERANKLDLSSVRSIVPAAEPLSVDYFETFYNCFKANGLSRRALNAAYGLAEATLLVSGHTEPEPAYLQVDSHALLKDKVVLSEHNENSRTYVGCGNDFGGQSLKIVNPTHFHEVGAGEVGEVWVSGPSISKGYWKNKEATEETFQAKITDEPENRNYLRTGDLGFIHNGQLFITGRLKDVLIFRGQCHYPNDIEATAVSADSLAAADGAAAFSVELDGEEQLMIVLEAQRADAEKMQQLVDNVREKVAQEHQLSAARIIPIRKGTLLRTTSGKVRRRSIKQAYLEQQLHVIYEETVLNHATQNTEASIPGLAALEQWLKEQAAKLLGTISARNIDVATSLFSYGFDSMNAATLLSLIQKQWQIQLPENALFDNPTVKTLSEHILGHLNPAENSKAEAHSTQSKTTGDDIAIIGMAFRFPGADLQEAQTDEAFWDLLLAGESAIRPMPSERFRRDDSIPGFGGFLNRPADFDAAFFGMSPREAINTDPQQRMLLEVSWHSLEDAGIPPSQTQGGDVGVYVGIGTADYSHIPFATGEDRHLDPYYGTGTSFAAASGRVSYFFGWEGPSVAVDTACSSSHSALHMACQALRLGECEMALAAGVKLQFVPEIDQVLTKAGMLAADGQCKTFDQDADGYVRGEGCACFILKPLAQAQADGDRIRAVIKGSLVRQDGASSSLSAPNRDAQKRLLQKTLAIANLTPDQIDYIELHGTGTRLGDPIEYQSVSDIFSQRNNPNPLILGSVKSNIGHLEAAAGASGLVKTILALEKKQIPPHIGIRELNPLIDLSTIPAELPNVAVDWPETQAPARAGVTSYGFTGTISHVVLEQAPERSTESDHRDTGTEPQVLLISARSHPSLVQLQQQLTTLNDQVPLSSLASSLARLRDHHPHRLALVASDHQQLQALLTQPIDTTEPVSGTSRVGFMFTGQGAQYIGMAEALYQHEPAFKKALDEVDTALKPHLAQSIIELIHEGDSAQLEQTSITQPALFAVGYALARLWQDYGVQPSVLLGHSIGEFAALVIAGVISLTQAAKLIVNRGRLMQQLPAGGGMLAVRLSVSQMESVLLALAANEAEKVAIAAINGEQDIVIAGDLGVLDSLRQQLEQQSVSCRPLAVSHAFHSPMLEPMLDEWQQVCQPVTTQLPRIPVVSTLTGKPMNSAPDSDYWRQHARQSVNFIGALEQAFEQCDILLEIGPHAILSALAKRHLSEKSRFGAGSVIASQQRGVDQLVTFRQAMAALYQQGVDFHWQNSVNSAFSAPLLSPSALPRYPFDQKSYWYEYDEDASRPSKPLQPSPLREHQQPVSLYHQTWQPFQPLPATNEGQCLWLTGDPRKARELQKRIASQIDIQYCNTAQQLVSDWRSGDMVVYLPHAKTEHHDATWPMIEWAQSIQGLNGSLKILLLTENAHIVDAQKMDKLIDPDQSALLGAARSLAIEYPACQWLMLDIDDSTAVDSALLSQIQDQFDQEDTLAIREGQWFRRYLSPLEDSEEPADTQTQIVTSPESSYLVVGALGALGRHISEWLIQHGAKKMILTSRKAPSHHLQNWIDHWQARGVDMQWVQTDITDTQSVSELFQQIDRQALKGVFHCAGTGQFNTLDSIGYEDYELVTQSKISGTALLDQHTREIDLDWFVCFTSISGIWGSRVQIHYGAANAWQDALIQQRRQQGLVGTSIAFGPWSGGAGMSEVDDNLLQYLRMAGIQRQAPARYLATLDKILPQNKSKPCAQVAVEVDWHKFVPLFSLYNQSDMFSLCHKASETSERTETSTAASLSLRDMSPEQQHDSIASFVRDELARTLHVAPHQVQPDTELLTLGLDSILVMDFSRRCTEVLAIQCSLKSLFENNTPAKVTSYLLELIEASTDQPTHGSQAMHLEHDAGQRYAPFPLTDLQYSYWVGRQDHYALGGVACHAYLEADADQALDLPRLERAWNQLIERHDALRLIIQDDGKQRVLPEVPFYRIQTADLSTAEAAQTQAHCEQWRELLSHQVLPADRWPLFDLRLTLLPQGRSRLHISIDMLINDATSSQIIWEEFIHLYQSEITGSHQALPTIDIQFRDYVLAKADRSHDREQQWQKDRQFWLDRLPTLPGAPQLPLVSENLNQIHPKFTRRQFTLAAPLWQQLRQQATVTGVTPASLLISAFSQILASWSSDPRFCLNLTIFDRLPWHEDIPRIVGDFTAITLLALDHEKNRSFAEHAQAVNSEVLDSLEHRSFSGVDVLRELNRGKEQHTLSGIPVVFTSQLGVTDPTKGVSENPLGDVAYGISQTPQVWLDHQASEQDGALVYCWDCVENIFQPGVLDAMFTGYSELLTQLAQQPQMWQQPLPALLPESQKQVRQMINDTTEEISNDTLDGLFLQQAQQSPDSIALISGDRHWSYRELQHWCAGIAQQLLKDNVQPGDRVAVVMHKCASQVASALAIQMIGAAYVPMSGDTPRQRLESILQGSRIKVILTQPEYVESVKGLASCIEVDIQHPQLSEQCPSVAHTPADHAYVIYTSGSTGTPKGVLIDHRGAVNTVLDINRRFAVTANDKVLGISSLWFDLSVYDMFGTFAAGGTLVLPDADKVKDPSHWLQLVQTHQISVWNSVPALLDLLLSEAQYLNQSLPLNVVFLSGDWIPLPLPGKLKTLTDNATLIAMGGATEASIWSNWFEVTELNPAWKSVPYGYPLTNQAYHVLDAQLRDCPDYVTGDLYISGIGVAVGYENDADKTAASFIERDGQRLYKTGDLARYWADGTLEFLGRNDFQVKIAGNRIELGEIEAVLQQHPDIRDAVVDTQGNPQGEKRLAGWLVLQEDPQQLCTKPETTASLNANQLTQHAEQLWATLPVPEQAKIHQFWQLIDQLGLRTIADSLASAERIHASAEYQPLLNRWQQLAGSGQFDNLDDWHTLQQTAGKFGLPRSTLARLQNSARERLEVISGQRNAMELFYSEDDSLSPEQLTQANPLSSVITALLAGLIRQLAANRAPLRILEIGSRSGIASQQLLQQLAGVKLDYTVSDASPLLLKQARQRLVPSEGQQLSFTTLDLEQSLDEQPWLKGQFDLVIAFNALHRSQNIPRLLTRIASLLNAGGWLLAPEMTRNSVFQLASVALLESGYQNLQDERALTAQPLLESQQWCEQLRQAGFAFNDAFGMQSSNQSGLHLLMAQLPTDQPRFSAGEVNAFLATRLPAYMIPQSWFVLDRLPLSATGKVARAQLPRPQTTTEAKPASAPAPQWRGLTEELANIWSDLLTGAPAHADSHFFESGGDSLTAVRLIEKVRHQLKRKVALQELFASPRFDHFARVVETAPEWQEEQRHWLADDANRYQQFPLTDVQEAYWIGRQSGLPLSGVATHLYSEIDVTGLSLPRLEDAWQKVVEHHDMLRAVIDESGMQRILPEVPRYRIDSTDLRQADTQQIAQWEQQIREQLSHKVHTTEHWPMFSIHAAEMDNKVRLCISLDNLICDGRSMTLLLSQWSDLAHNPDKSLQPLQIHFRDYVLIQETWNQRASWKSALNYWLERLDTLPDGPELPLIDSGANLISPHFTRRDAKLTADQWRALRQLANDASITPNGLLLSVWSSVLAHWSKNRHFSLNLTLFQRPDIHPELAEMVGDFTSLSLLECDLRHSESFIDQASRLQQQLFADLNHAEVSAVRVLREAAKRRGHLKPIAMPVVFTSGLGVQDDDEPSPGNTAPNPWLGEFGWSVSQTPQVWIDHQVVQRHGALCFSWDCVDALFPDGLLDDMFQSYTQLLELLASEPALWQQPLSTRLPEQTFKHQALAPQPEETAEVSDISHSDSRAISHQICRQLEQIAGVSEVAIDINFFEMGITSMHLIRLRQALMQQMSLEFPVVEVFNRPNARALGRWLARFGNGKDHRDDQLQNSWAASRREGRQRRLLRRHN